MAFERVLELGVGCPPWETTPNGVVSLLAMLEFSARDYVEISNQIGILLGSLRGQEPNTALLEEKFGKLISECTRLNLLITKEHIDTMMSEILGEQGSNVEWAKDGTVTIKGDLNIDRVCHHLESIYVALRAELGAILFKAIPREKAKFCDPKWQTTGPMFAKFPESVDELQKAGRCYAYGENTACVFHLLRVADFYFRRVAESLNISYDARNWHGIGKKITEEMEKKYQVKTDEWKKNEPFYAEILTDLQAIGRGHRNPTLHELEKKYEEREAEYMLTVIKSFAKRVAEKL
jgi:hypothetical protein